jgi:hypothetical protein
MNCSAPATAVKNVASPCVFIVSVLNCITMLVDASTSRAMRRPGYDTSSRVNPVWGSVRAMAKNGNPATKSSTGR